MDDCDFFTDQTSLAMESPLGFCGNAVCESESESEDDPFSSSTACVVDDRTWSISTQLTSDALSPLFADEWTGSIVWRCSLELAKMLPELLVAARPPLPAPSSAAGASPPPRQRLRAVELGSGCGLVALRACELGYATLATDQGSMVPLIARNGEANLVEDEAARFSAAEIEWGTPLAERVEAWGGRYDVVLVSDCLNPIYGEESYAALAMSVRALAARGALLVLAFEARGAESRPIAAAGAIAAQVASCVAARRGCGHRYATHESVAAVAAAGAATLDANDADADALATLQLGEPLLDFFRALLGGHEGKEGGEEEGEGGGGGEEEEDGALRLTAQLTLERIVMAARGTGAGGEAPIMVYTAALSSSY